MAEHPKHILIVDDDEELCELLAQAIKDLSTSYNIKTAKNVDEAMVHVRAFQKRKSAFDLVITDIKMTGLSGLELLEVLNSIAPQTKTITMTAYNSAELAQRAQQLNVYAYLTKPFAIPEFRHIVQGALSAESVVPEAKSTELNDAQRKAVDRQLATLRTMTGANATFLIQTSGEIVAINALEPDMSVGQLGQALVQAQQNVIHQLSQHLSVQTPIQQSYFGTETYSICTYRIDESFFAAVLFGPAVKEGQVWYYMRDVAEGLLDALSAQEDEESSTAPSRRHDVFDMLDQFFPGETKRRRRRASTTSKPSAEPEPPVQSPEPKQDVEQETNWEPAPVESNQEPAPTMSFEQAQKMGLLAEIPFVQETDSPSQGEPDDSSPPEIDLDEIDWDVSEDADWESLVTETDQPFEGLSLQEAQQEGLIGNETIEPAEGNAAASVEAPSLDEIDWDVSLEDADWDSIVAETDQNIDSVGLDQAHE